MTAKFKIGQRVLYVSGRGRDHDRIGNVTGFDPYRKRCAVRTPAGVVLWAEEHELRLSPARGLDEQPPGAPGA
jgi:hypothetical protein